MDRRIIRSGQPGVAQTHLKVQMRNAPLRRHIVWGLAGGLVGTIAMDLFGAGLFLIMGQPMNLSFSIIGDAAAGFLAMLGQTVAGGAPLGAVLHYLIGLGLGGLLGAAVARIAAWPADSVLKGVGLGILYVEIMSQPLLAAAAVILRMTTTETLLWFGVSIVMHLVYGLILGVAVSCSPRSAPMGTGR